MIGNFSDHAADERAFLAWVRTAIAVMAFGFRVKRFVARAIWTSMIWPYELTKLLLETEGQD
jgi:uncharacterized membrane protein YidH (DUF202 family)